MSLQPRKEAKLSIRIYLKYLSIICLLFITFLQVVYAQKSITIINDDWRISGIRSALNDPNINVLIYAFKNAGNDRLKLLFSVDSELRNSITNRHAEIAIQDSQVFSLFISLLETKYKNEHLTSIIPLLGHKESLVRKSAILSLITLENTSLIEVEHFLSAIKDPNRDVKLEAIRALGEYSGQQVIDALSVTLNDEERDVRMATIKALGQVGSKNAVRLLLSILNEVDGEYFLEVVRSLGIAGGPKATNALSNLIDKETGARSAFVLDALGVIGGDLVIEVLIQTLNKDDSGLQIRVLNVLGNINDDRALDAIISIFRDDDENIRKNAVKQLSNFKVKKSINALVSSLEDDDIYVREYAVNSLNTIGGKQVAKPLIIALNNSAPDIRGLAAEYLKFHVSKEVIDALRLALTDLNEGVKYQVLKTLQYLKASFAIETLIPLLTDDNDNVRSIASELITKHKGNRATKALLASLDDDSESAVYHKWVALTKVAGESEIPFFSSTLIDPKYYVENRQHSAIALGNIGTEKAIDTLIDMLNDDSDTIFSTVTKSLARTGNDRAIATLVARLKHESELRRKKLLVALSYVKSELAVNLLTNALSDKSKSVRYEAVHLLSGIEGEKANGGLVIALNSDDKTLREAAIEYLADRGATTSINYIISTISEQDEYGKTRFIRALQKLADLKMKSREKGAVELLSSFSDKNLELVLIVLKDIYDNSTRKDYIRYTVHLFSERDENAIIIAKWLGDPGISTPDLLATLPNNESRIDVLKAFRKAWDFNDIGSKFRNDLARNITAVLHDLSVNIKDQSTIKLLSDIRDELSKRNYQSAVTAFNVKLADISKHNKASIGLGVLLSQLIFWILLLFVYPHSPIVQSIFFWNPWIRRIVGFGYIGFLLTWVPSLRRILFRPFTDNLLVDANLDSFNDDDYFEGCEVIISGRNQRDPIAKAIALATGQVIIEAESGMGKSMCLKRYAIFSNNIVAFIPASRCKNGVMAALQEKLHGPANDEVFLKSLIYSGSINICIDGVNEVSPQTRANITEFADRYFRSNIIMTTQPMEWLKPVAAKTWKLQPLSPQHIKQFLLSRRVTLKIGQQLSEVEYVSACETYLKQVLNDDIPEEVRQTTLKVLSNPMDLTIIAQMIGNGKSPQLFNLREQQYQTMAEDYMLTHYSPFPLEQFAENCFDMRLNDIEKLDEEHFANEIACLDRHKMVVVKYKEANGNVLKDWKFRHDKIMDYFVAQTFLGEKSSRQVEYLDDARFRGVYFLLGDLLPIEQAEILRESLIQYAAKEKDHSVSDDFISILNARNNHEKL
jgi:HEAT repeat protein